MLENILLLLDSSAKNPLPVIGFLILVTLGSIIVTIIYGACEEAEKKKCAQEESDRIRKMLDAASERFRYLWNIKKEARELLKISRLAPEGSSLRLEMFRKMIVTGQHHPEFRDFIYYALVYEKYENDEHMRNLLLVTAKYLYRDSPEVQTLRIAA